MTPYKQCEMPPSCVCATASYVPQHQPD